MSRARAARPLLTLVAALVAAAACQGKRDGDRAAGGAAPAATGSGSATAAATGWIARCDATLASAAKLTPARRAAAVIHGCRPCGDWAPLLDWATPATAGGPTTDAIERAMTACRAYCTPRATQAFLGALEGARGTAGQRPWRLLGAECGAAVSAAPDDPRFMSAPYFALDRIARAAAAEPALAARLPALALPLPPASLTGAALALPASPAVKPDPGPLAVTATMTELLVGALPRARLGAGGITVETAPAGAAPYPGGAAAPAALAEVLARLQPGAAPIALLAPRGMPATRVLDAVRAAGERRLALAAAAGGAPRGWELPGIIPVALGARPAPGALRLAIGGAAPAEAAASVDAAIRAVAAAPPAALATAPTIALARGATVELLAKLLGVLAHRGAAAATLEPAARS